MTNFDSFAALNAACVAAFGEPVSYRPVAGDAFNVTGIFEKTTDEERHADGLYARLFLNLTDCPAQPGNGDRVTVAGSMYTVFEVQLDTSGGVRLSLRA